VSTTGDEEQLWVGEYREDKGQILNLYNRVTKQIAHEVHIELTDGEEQALSKDRAADRDAIDAYIRSHTYWGDLSAEAFDKAEEFLNLAMEKDPEWATLYAGMAIVWVGRMQMGMVDTETGRRQIETNIKRARELDPDFVDSHFINGIIYSWPDWKWEKGEQELRQAITLDPNHIIARMYYAHLLMILQRMDEALVQGKLALELDPKNPLILALYSTLLKGDGQPKAALEYIEKALAIDPDHSFTRGQLGRALYNTGQYERELEMQENHLIKKLGRQKVPDLVAIYREHGRLAAYQEVVDFIETHAEVLGYGPGARSYYRAEAYTKALDDLEKALEVRNPNLPYIGTGTRYEALHDSARFLAILDSMNLPHP
jgi:tetratricopeptide (TPR) repeat protein